MRKKIDDHYKAEIDAAFAVDRTKIDVTWVPKPKYSLSCFSKAHALCHGAFLTHLR